MACCPHKAVMLCSPCRQAATKAKRWSKMQVSIHGIGRSSRRHQNLSPILPVQSITHVADSDPAHPPPRPSLARGEGNIGASASDASWLIASDEERLSAE